MQNTLTLTPPETLRIGCGNCGESYTLPPEAVRDAGPVKSEWLRQGVYLTGHGCPGCASTAFYPLDGTLVEVGPNAVGMEDDARRRWWARKIMDAVERDTLASIDDWDSSLARRLRAFFSWAPYIHRPTTDHEARLWRGVALVALLRSMTYVGVHPNLERVGSRGYRHRDTGRMVAAPPANVRAAQAILDEASPDYSALGRAALAFFRWTGTTPAHYLDGRWDAMTGEGDGLAEDPEVLFCAWRGIYDGAASLGFYGALEVLASMEVAVHA